MYSNTDLPIREGINQSHKAAIESFHTTGTWFDGISREKILREFRFADANSCETCRKHKLALSPYTDQGPHQFVTDLPKEMVEVIHRLTTDSGRLTEKWFRGVLDSGLSQEQYIEILGCVATAITLDTFALAIDVGLKLPVEKIDMSEPSMIRNPAVVREDAWVPVSERSLELGPSGLPTVPNIARAMGLVPSAVGQFFSVMRSHYGLTELESELSRSQTELIAARTSAHNDCFY